MSQATKDQLRKKLKAERQKLTAVQVIELSNIVAVKCLENINWKGIKSINVYSPIEKWRELDPRPLIEALQKGLPYLKVTVQPNTSSVKISKSVRKFNAVIVPTLGFDKKGYRLGMGGAFYDKFLAAQPKALKIGLCYEHGLIKNGLPKESHDIPLDIIITEGIIISRDSNSHKNRKTDRRQRQRS